MSIPIRIGLAEAIEQLQLEKNHRFTTVMRHGTMSVEYYAPQEKDPQTPHLQDELYIIAAGQSDFNRDG